MAGYCYEDTSCHFGKCENVLFDLMNIGTKEIIEGGEEGEYILEDTDVYCCNPGSERTQSKCDGLGENEEEEKNLLLFLLL
jgi:hypothetical protein